MTVYDRLSRTAAAPGLFKTLRRSYLLFRRAVRRLGIDLLLASYDSPLPDVAALPPGFFDRPDPLRGLQFDVDGQIELIERELADYCREFDPPGSPAEAGRGRFYLHNGTYESVDAELLYAVVRRFCPRRVVELGSGYSTLILREALARGGADGAQTLQTYDPYRSPLIPADWPVMPLPAQEVPEEVFAALQDGDVLFVDTSHTVKAGGDVNRIVLEILPILAPGVIVHFHDIFLPYPYSKSHLDGAHFWNEQYLLQAFLSGNPAWEILIGAQAVARVHPGRLAAAVPSFAAGVSPGAFWIRHLTD